MATNRKTVIVGAGIIGVTLAYVLARRGGHDVLVLESADGVARGVTSLGSGGYRVQFTHPEEVALTLRTIRSWAEIEREHGVDLDLHRGGYLTLGSTERAVRTIDEAIGMQRAAGADVRLVRGAELAALVPGMRIDGVPVGAFSPGDGWGHPPTIADLLRGLAEDAGARFRFGTTVTGVDQRAGRVAAVELRTAAGVESIAADVVVNAAGLGSPAVAEAAGLPHVVGTWRQHQFRTVRIPGVGDTSFPCVLDPAHDLYLRPAGDAVLVGYAEAEDAVLPGYEPDTGVEERARQRLAALWPEAAAEPFARAWVGSYELTPDRRACIGLAPELDGYAYATGFSGHGLMNSGGAAQALAQLLDGEEPFVPLAAFDRHRFSADDTTRRPRTDDGW